MTAGVVSSEPEIGNFLNHPSANNINTPPIFLSWKRTGPNPLADTRTRSANRYFVKSWG